MGDAGIGSFMRRLSGSGLMPDSRRNPIPLPTAKNDIGVEKRCHAKTNLPKRWGSMLTYSFFAGTAAFLS
jgi:hypothetical protein